MELVVFITVQGDIVDGEPVVTTSSLVNSKSGKTIVYRFCADLQVLAIRLGSGCLDECTFNRLILYGRGIPDGT